MVIDVDDLTPDEVADRVIAAAGLGDAAPAEPDVAPRAPSSSATPSA